MCQVVGTLRLIQNTETYHHVLNWYLQWVRNMRAGTALWVSKADWHPSVSSAEP